MLDNDASGPDPAPVTTIAWRLGHLHWGFAGRWEWTFGARRRSPLEFIHHMAEIALLRDLWRAHAPNLR